MEGIDKLQNLSSDELSVILAIYILGSLNLKQIAALLGKISTTTLNYVRTLLQHEYILLDGDKSTSRRGKYYTLNQIIKQTLDKVFQTNREKFEKEINNVNLETFEEVQDHIVQILREKDNQLLASTSLLFSNLNHAIETIQNNRMTHFIEDLNNNNTPRFPPTLINLLSVARIKISNTSQLAKINDLLLKFHDDIKKIEDDTDSGAREIQEIYFYNYITSLDLEK